MKFIVTGGAGYIGSHTCKALRKSGHEPVVVDNLSNGHEWAVKWGPFENVDVRDAGALAQVFEKHNPDGVFHFSGLIEVGESVKYPARFYDNNVTGSINLLNVMNDSGCRNIVFSSTCATYGIPEVQPINESTPQNPINPYGHSKLMIEIMLSDFADSYGFNPAILRYFNACGADPDGDIGEAHVPETHLIPRVLMAVNGELDTLDVFGDDFPTPDGTAVRDYIHVCDLADGHVDAMEKLTREKKPITCNLGTGKGTSVQEIIDAAERVTGAIVPVRKAPRRAGDYPVLIADTTLSSKILNFSPKFLDVDETIHTAWRWHQKLSA